MDLMTGEGNKTARGLVGTQSSSPSVVVVVVEGSALQAGDNCLSLPAQPFAALEDLNFCFNWDLFKWLRLYLN